MELLKQKLILTNEGADLLGFLSGILFSTNSFFLILAECEQVGEKWELRATKKTEFHLIDGVQSPTNFMKACKMAENIAKEFNQLNGSKYSI